MGGIHPDPLALNVLRQWKTVVHLLGEDASIPEPSTLEGLVIKLSDLLFHREYTILLALTFRPILFVLCARWLDQTGNESEKLAAFASLLNVHEELFPIFATFIRQTPFTSGLLIDIQKLTTTQLHLRLLSYYRILFTCPEAPTIFNWSSRPLLDVLKLPGATPGIKCLAIHSYAIHVRISENRRDELLEEHLGPLGEADVIIESGLSLCYPEKTIDGWVLPLSETLRVRELREKLLVPVDYYQTDDTEPSIRLDLTKITSRIANIEGILLLKQPHPPRPSKLFILTSSAKQTLHAIALRLSLRLPILLSSPPSGGKYTILNHLTSLLYPASTNRLVAIHLADTSTDAKSLFGSYISSTKSPGSFEWQDGVIVKAMKEGCWLVLEDIDRATPDILGALVPIVEGFHLQKHVGTPITLELPGRPVVVAAGDFAIFATRSVTPRIDGSFPEPTFLGAHKFSRVDIPQLTENDLLQIISEKYPAFVEPIAVLFINVWLEISRLPPVAGVRSIGIHDLEAWCKRVNLVISVPSIANVSLERLSFSILFPNIAIREEIYVQARDIFFGTGAFSEIAKAHYDTISDIVAKHLDLDPDRIHWITQNYRPEMHLEKDTSGRILSVSIGRIHVPAAPAVSEFGNSKRPFATHRSALLLLEKVATCISMQEPVLLVGETGTGKTTSVSYLSTLLNRPLISLNLSNQTESSDLLGNFKPVDAKIPAGELQQRFIKMFALTFSRKKNAKFEQAIRIAVNDAKWKKAVGLWKECVRLALEKIRARTQLEVSTGENEADENRQTLDDGPRKRRKLQQNSQNQIHESDWVGFAKDVDFFDMEHVRGRSRLTFRFIEGPLVRALRDGSWVLLDEINLASSETLECVSSILRDPTASIVLGEQGSFEPIPRHPDFRLFACMNPATDVGKRDLPMNIRTRFTEIFVPSPDTDKDALLSIVYQYIGHCTITDKAALLDVVDFYMQVKSMADKHELADGSNRRPHFSIRTLARALMFASHATATFGLRRALWEGCLMAFAMALESSSADKIKQIADRVLLSSIKNLSSIMSHIPSTPSDSNPDRYERIGPFWIECGNFPKDPVAEYVLTPSVQTKLTDLARIIYARRFPVLIEGPTSSGKTSAVEYLARRTGHRFVRINNHEHTDIQEYLGSYLSDPDTGRLVFRDGMLVRALRNGDWIVLDELNLAPTDVLEALNRLLDDNRELFIPETQEVIKPHPHFMLFATQNPPGLYAGRKQLSRAFRNRFLEVHFDDVPQSELQFILSERCRIPESYAKKIVNVFQELAKRRQANRVFEAKHSFATLRDLFRWGNREASTIYELAKNGYMILAERTRRLDDKKIVKEVIESVMKEPIREEDLYQQPPIGTGFPISSNIIWTSTMRRLFVLVATALQYNEPVLLVGETGSGKTSVCHLYASAVSKALTTLSCHQSTETSDLIGGQRPIRNRTSQQTDLLAKCQKMATSIPESYHSFIPSTVDEIPLFLNQLKNISEPLHTVSEIRELHTAFNKASALFEWRDGPLVQSMQEGNVFLLDEISLADDSVLERLNSVLESSRSIILAEKGGVDIAGATVTAHPEFKLIATMNPGGDYGKKELSPALRNRFTEIWVPSIDSIADLQLIIDNSWRHGCLREFTQHILSFRQWINNKLSASAAMSMRDILTVVTFMNKKVNSEVSISPSTIFYHAIHMACLDGLETSSFTSSWTFRAIHQLRQEAEFEILKVALDTDIRRGILTSINHLPSHVSVGPFDIVKGPAIPENTQTYNLVAPTTLSNVGRLFRACQLDKPILLEGSPGVGKTSLISALAHIACQRLVRINLSDQTELIDLFGTDYPVEGSRSSSFAWKEAAFLQAMQSGDWVLLDEMNLATQTVLEGLNAVLDHRGSVFIPELGQTFPKHANFRIFGAQNPLGQGGGRKGLPKSFLDRFTKVYVQTLTLEDMYMICQSQFPQIQEDWIRSMVVFNSQLQEETIKGSLGKDGGPWEFNIRDVLRWASLLSGPYAILHPSAFLDPLYLQRFRTVPDREYAIEVFRRVFGTFDMATLQKFSHLSISKDHLQLGGRSVKRGDYRSWHNVVELQKFRRPLAAAGICIDNGWLTIISGTPNTGKTHLVRYLAATAGFCLREVSLSNAMDTGDILGSFEQIGGDNDDIVQFGWVDGPLLKAMKEGYWLVFDNANLCSPSVLDRLNSLCEPNGYLTLTERGHVNGATPVIYPHPNFRLILVIDPRNGELSRAMRNRGVEIHLVDRIITGQDARRLYDACRISPQLYSDSGLERDVIKFEKIRRGCLDKERPEPNSDITLRPGSLIYDSALMSLWDNLMLQRSFHLQNSSMTEYASTDLLVRHFPPLALPLLRSYAKLMVDKEGSPLIGFLRNISMSNNIFRTRATVAFESSGLPLTVSGIQPLDICLRHEPWCSMDNSLVPLTTAFSHILGLIVQSRFCTMFAEPEESFFHQSRCHYSRREKPASTKPGIASLYPLYSETISLVNWITSQSPSFLVENPNKLHQIKTLIDFAEHLRDSALGAFLDFSSAVVINHWYHGVLNEARSTEYHALRSCLEEFSDAVRLTSGHGMHDIWKALMCRCALVVESSSKVLDNKSLFPGSDLSLSVDTATHNGNDYNRINYPPVLAIIEWSWIISACRLAFGNPGNDVRRITRLLVDVGQYFGRDRSPRYYYVEQVLSSFDNNEVNCQNQISHIAFYLRGWMKAINTVCDQNSVDIKTGPTVLLNPVLLRDVFSLCFDDITFKDLNKQYTGLALHARILLHQCSDSLPTRLDQLHTLWVNSMFLLAKCFETTFSTEDWEFIRKAAIDMDALVLTTLLIRTSHSELSQVMATRIHPIAKSLEKGSDGFLPSLARGWIELGLSLLELYLPDFPMDPLAIEKSTFDFLEKRERKLSSLLKFAELAAESLYGDQMTPLIFFLSTDLETVRGDLNKRPEPSSRSVDLNRLQSLFDEIRPFMNQFIFNGKLMNTIMAITYHKTPMLLHEMITIRANITGFLRRLDTGYADLADIVQPISMALLFVQFGLHLFIPTVEMDTSTNLLIPSLIKSPVIAAIHEAEVLTHNESTPEQIMFSLIASSYKYVLEYNGTTDFTQIGRAYDKIAILWLKQNSIQEQREKAAESLYRHKEELTGSDDDEFDSLFPSFNEENEYSLETKPREPTQDLALSPNSKHVIYSLHRMVACGVKESATLTDLASQYWQLRYHLLYEVLKTAEPLVELDKDTLPIRLSLIWNSLKDLPRRQSSYNFYHDSNISETKKAFSIIESIRERLNQLLREWPEQMVLQHLLDRCDVILQLNIKSSIARVLAALEQLVSQIADWESYANRENSLATYQTAITDTIILWRRMELSSWSNLLESEISKFELDTAEWWVRMYDLTVRGSLHAERFDGYLTEMVSVIDEFVSTSSLGNYNDRLQLIVSFAEHTWLLAHTHDNNGSQRLHRVSRILSNIHEYYVQFSSIVSRAVNEKRTPIEKELQDYMKLASWKDTNVYALQQSAQRTHRHLYKCIRKFRQVLKEPTATLLSVEQLNADSESSANSDLIILDIRSGEYPEVEKRITSGAIPSYLVNLSKTLSNFRQVLQSSGQRFIDLVPYCRVETFAVEVLTISTQLASESDAAGSDLKAQKVLLMRKRRAWIDLLQGLKNAGFSSRTKPDILRHQVNRLWLLDHPSLKLEENNRAYLLASKSRSYFNRLLISLPTLRNSFSSHHSDVTTGDLQRAINFVESSYNFFLVAYTRYCTDCNHYRALNSMVNRLLSLSHSSDGSNIHIESIDVIRFWLRICLGLKDALKDLLVDCNRMSELDDCFLLSSSVIENITECADALKEDQEALYQLGQTAGRLHPSFMDSDELQRFTSIRDRIVCISESLQRWIEDEPRLQYLCRPIITWLSDSISARKISADSAMAQGDSQESESKTIELLLLTAQGIRSRGQTLSEVVDSEEGFALTSAKSFEDLSRSLGLDRVIARVESFLLDLGSCPPKGRLAAIRHVIPFVNAYLQLVDPILQLQASYVKGSGKLTYTLSRLITSISEKGFCKPPEGDDQQTDENNNGQLQDGTGFGEGTGKDDVGHEVGDESQVEGLQGETKDNQEDSGQTQDGEGMEMDGMDGETQDVDQGSNDSESGTDGTQSDIEDIVDNVNDETSEKVDEKLWEGEPEDDKQQNDQAGKNSKTAGDDIAPKADGSSVDSDQLVEEAAQDDNASDGDNPPDGQDAPPIDAGKQLENSVPEESVLDLPDDIDLNRSEGGDSPDGLDDMSGGEDQELDEIASQLDKQSISEETPEEEGAKANDDEMLLQDDSQQDAPSADDTAEGTMEDSSRGNQEAAPKQDTSKDTSMAEDPTDALEATDAADPSKDNLEVGNEGLNQGTDMNSLNNGAMDVDQHDAGSMEAIAMGDASKPVHGQWEDIASADPTRPSVLNSELPSQVEYLPNDQDDPNDLQALGPAKDKEPVANEDVQMLDNEKPSKESNEKHNRDQPSESMKVPPGQKKEANNSKSQGDRPSENHPSESRDPNNATSSTEDQDLLTEAAVLDMLGSTSISEENVEEIIKKWYEIGRPESLAGPLWRVYESLTRDLSFILCEQLRLILAPTLATRLKGDYKTGKKLNMKKIIPYIASDYTKDKIWLRRTRPSQREYQILIALDDSRSMGESGHSVHLAYETLALVTKALNRLEVGEIAVASFGETFELAHRFEDGVVGEREGEKLMKSFTFSQTKTDILGLIQCSVNTLLEARERRALSASNSSAGDLWQLEIIVSDGICQDHEQLRNALRMAEENRILVVFIIIDSLHKQTAVGATTSSDNVNRNSNTQSVHSSILTMNQVSYQNVNGKMELQLARYLDTFPFQYYLILREVEALPDVLASTLKQFFERISEQ